MYPVAIAFTVNGCSFKRIRCVVAAGTDSNQTTGTIKLMMGKVRA